MTKNNDYNCGCILPTNVVDVIMFYIDIRFAQNTTQTLIGGKLKTTPAFDNVSAGWPCRVDKPMARLMLGRIFARSFVGDFVLAWMGL